MNLPNIYIGAKKKISEKSSLSFTFKYAFLAYVLGRIRQPLDTPNLINVDEVYNNSSDSSISSYLNTGDFLTLNKFIQLDSQLEYSYSLSKTIDFVATYHFRFYQYRKFLLTSVGNSNLLTGIRIKL